MFQFARFPLPALCIQTGVVRHDPYQVFLFGDPRIKACLAAPRGLSQPATSFIGFQRQGIHRVPFATCRDDARARYGILKGHGDPCPAPGQTASESGCPVRPRIRSLTGPKGAQTATFKAAQCAHTQNTGGSRPVITTLRRSPRRGHGAME